MRAFAPLILLASLGSVGLSGCATTAPTAAPTSRAAPAFVAEAVSSDLFELESGRMALQRSRNPAMRSHAEMMIRDHAFTSAQLKAAAVRAGVTVPTRMLPVHAAMLEELTRATDFDATYRRQQVLSHRQTLRLMDRYARRGDLPQLRGVAAATVPVVRAHLDSAGRM